MRVAFDLPREKRSSSQRRALVELMIVNDPAYGDERAALEKLRAAEPRFVTTMVVSERSGEPRPTHIHLGGDFTRKGERVRAGRSRACCPAWRIRVRELRRTAWTWPAGWSIAAIR